MKKGLNSWSIIGNVGKDPDVRHTTNGTAVCSFSVAINSSWKNASGETQEHVEWVNVVCWQKLAEICAQYVKKGLAVFVEGRAQTRSWDDKETGQKRYTTELVANNVIFLSGKREEGAGDSTQPGEAVNTAEGDDLPF